jgi:nitroreductase
MSQKLFIVSYLNCFMQLKDAIESRKSVKRFHHKKPNWRKIIRAIDAARFAPSAGNKFVTRFILVSNEKKLAELTAASQQDFVGDVKYIVVVVSDDTALVRGYGEDGVRYAAQQAGAAIENFLLALNEQKLATTWVGHFYREQVRRTLDIPEGLHIEAMFPIGVETKIKTSSRGKMKLDQIIYFDKWKEKKMKDWIKMTRSAI